MARQHIVDIGMNDQLPEVIRKCNYNFRVSAASQSRQSKSDVRNYNIDTADSIEELRLVCSRLDASKSAVAVTQILSEGERVAVITVDGVDYAIFAPAGGGGSSDDGPCVPVPDASDSAPAMDGTAAAGSSADYARADHVHPTDTSRAPLASPALTGTPTAPTATAGTSTTQIATTEFVATAVANAISGIQGISYEVVTSLPGTGSAGVIYLMSNGGSASNVYDEYIWLGSSYEKIGTTVVDLSGYWAKSELVAMTVAEVDAICV